MSDRAHVFSTVADMAPGIWNKAGNIERMDAALDAFEGKVPAPVESGAWIEIAAPLVEKWEGYATKQADGSVKAYPDPATGGKPWTIGIGSTTDENGKPITPGTVWSRERAVARFKAHLAEFGEGVDKLLEGAPTTPQQKAAMTSLAYNIGLGAFGSSTLLRRHKAGRFAEAADQFGRWNRAAGREMKGLTRRRADEAELYRDGS